MSEKRPDIIAGDLQAGETEQPVWLAERLLVGLGPLPLLAALIATGAVVYALAVQLLGAADHRELRAMLRREA